MYSYDFCFCQADSLSTLAQPVHFRRRRVKAEAATLPVRLGRERLRSAAAPRTELILHGPDGRLTAEADAIHRGERLIDWGG
jgi:hypothetical protein